jgi:hypothetical protein
MAGSGGGPARLAECSRDGRAIAFSAQNGKALAFVGLDLGADPPRLRVVPAGDELVDADDGPGSAVDFLGHVASGRLDLVPLEAVLNRGDCAAPFLDRWISVGAAATKED